MAWRSSGATNAELISNLFRNGLITTPRVRDAMLKVDRTHYCPDRHAAYQDSPQPIGHSATISAPHMHASACESLLPYLPLLPSVPSTTSPPSSPLSTITSPSSAPASSPHPRPPLRVLDIGSGSGYLTHVLAELVGASGQVIGVEHIVALRDLGEANMRKSSEGRAFLEEGRVRFVVGDGRKGWVEGEGEKGEKGEKGEGDGGWDAIHVGAAAVKVHEELVAQLRRPGRLFIPVDDEKGWGQHIYVIDKDDKGVVTKKKLYGVSYVPLTDAPK